MIEQTDIINEMWRSISGYMNYQISNIGRVRNTDTGKILKNTLLRGYYIISLNKTGNWKTYGIHTLVAQEFLEKPEVEHKLVVDHIDRNRSNNQVTNLRYVSYSQNNMNRSKQANCTSMYKGVSWHSVRRKWQSQIVVDKRNICLGYFESEIEAASTYAEAAKEHYKEYACINNIDQSR